MNKNKISVTLEQISLPEQRSFADKLLVAAFPASERPTLENLHSRTDRRFIKNLIIADGQYAGILYLWEFDGFVFVEHLAVSESMRGMGIGALALKVLNESTEQPIVLEVEPPDTNIAARRIEFYKRNGFILSDLRYAQPPYCNSSGGVNLCLMTHGNISERALKEAVETIRNIVYGVRTI